MEPITVKLGEETHSGFNYGDKKELVRAISLIVEDGEKLFDLVCVRWYMGRSRTAERMYCTIWIHGVDFYTSGSGWAGGWGYDKYSASLDSALRDANIELSRSIHGVGDEAIHQAIMGIGKVLGYEKMCIVTHS